uniref:DUF1995 domain-containing protein n=1 Tax=Skeletonema marinoi TaxID=267567 RepID=A0A7S1GEB7_9STRA
MLHSSATRRIITCSLLLVGVCQALIPATPGEQTRRAIVSTRDTISKIREANKPPRIYVDYLIPLPPATSDADIDPWPGGLAQQYPYAEDIVREILAGVVEDSIPEKCSSQVISASDCCGLFIQESPNSPELDVAALLFPSPDQFENMKEIEQMVGDKRTLLIFNRQYTRAADFGFFKKGESQKFLDKFEWAFAFQEIACRGEDVKLIFEQAVGWNAAVIDENGKEIDVMDEKWDVTERPDYLELEKKINEVIPEPLWMRKMQEVSEKGLKFQRKE